MLCYGCVLLLWGQSVQSNTPPSTIVVISSMLVNLRCQTWTKLNHQALLLVWWLNSQPRTSTKNQNTTWNDDSQRWNKVVDINHWCRIHSCLPHYCWLLVVYSPLLSCLVPYQSISTIWFCSPVSWNYVFFISQWLMSAASLLHIPGGLIALPADSLVCCLSCVYGHGATKNNCKTDRTAINLTSWEHFCGEKKCKCDILCMLRACLSVHRYSKTKAI